MNATTNQTKQSPRGALRPRRTSLERLKTQPVAAHGTDLPAPMQIRRLLVATDFSPASLKAVQYGVSFAKQFGATVCLLHVVETAPFISDLANVPLAMSETEVARSAQKKLATLAEAEIEELVPVDTRVRVGKAFQEIVSAAKELNSDLIIIATHGYTGLKHAFLGSTAERVVRHAPCPVLVVREREHEFI
jgi:nucleotide-binding universal stress UspA family protein